MGMYDYVQVEVPLPDGWEPSPYGLQTKHFDCELTSIRITKDGRLLRERFHYETVPLFERRNPLAKGLEALGGIMRTVSDGWEEVSFHGVFRMVGVEAKPTTEDPHAYVWHEYRVKFTDGRLVKITATDENGEHVVSGEQVCGPAEEQK